MRLFDVLASNEAFRTKWFTIQRYLFRLGPSDTPQEYLVHEASDSAMCIAVTTDGTIPLVQQFRFPIRRVSLDYPAGAVDASDAGPMEAALRELQEETALVVEHAAFLVTLDKDPGFSASRMHVFLARNVKRANRSPHEPGERVLYFHPQEIIAAITSGEISCSHCIAATFLVAKTLGWISYARESSRSRQ